MLMGRRQGQDQVGLMDTSPVQMVTFVLNHKLNGTISYKTRQHQ